MDDANLSKLTLNQFGLKPEFNKDTLNYEITVPFKVDILKISAVTSDKSASCSIKSNTGFGEQVKLVEGENKIQIEVTSEDGTIKKYFILCNRLSATNASLKYLKFDKIDIKPEFDSNILSYNAFSDFKLMDDFFELDAFDPDCVIQVLINNKQEHKDKDGKFQIKLNYGISLILIKITSSNKSNELTYSIKIIKKPFPRICSFQDSKHKFDYQDHVSLSAIYCPITLKKSQTNYSQPLIDILKIISNNESFIQNNDEYDFNIELENTISHLKIKVPYLNGLVSREVTLREIFTIIDEINTQDKFESFEDEIKKYNFSEIIREIPDTAESYQTKSWEKQLQIIYDETDSKILLKNSQDNFKKYTSLVNSGISKKLLKANNDESSAIYFLNKSIYEAATAIKFSTKDYTLHFWLASLLEEKHFFENIYGHEEREEKIITSLVLQNKQAEESSKEDEINAICKLRNTAATASNAEKLKALDMEYHHLKETNQHIKAEQIQALYQYKAKKIIQESKKDAVNNDNNNYIYQANIKYADGLSIIIQNKQENFTAFFTMGRSFFSIGDFKQALIYFKRCIQWSNVEFQTLSRFYFGFALSKQGDLIESNIKLILNFLCSGLELFLKNFNQNLEKNDQTPNVNNYYNIFNIEFIEAFLTVGKLKNSFPNSYTTLSSEDSFRYCAWLCCIALIEFNKKSQIDSETLQTSKLIKDIFNLLSDAHYNMTKLEINVTDENLKIKYHLNLIDLLRFFATYKENERALKIQEKISQELVFYNPTEFYFLYLLGSSKLELYELLYDNKLESDENYLNELLDDSKKTFIFCNETFENSIQDVSNLITDQKWWQKKVEAQQKKVASKNQNNDTHDRPVSRSSADKSKNKQDTKQNAPGLKISNKTQAQSNEKKPTANTQKKNPLPVKSVKNVPQCKPVKPETPPEKLPQSNTADTAAKIEEQPSIKKEKVKIKINMDRKIIFNQCQLYTARVYSRLNQFDLAKKFYLKAIENEPKKQDAYIELASMLKKNNDIMGAVDVYSKYPIELTTHNKNDNSNDESMDDAFICGELVTLLISIQNYDDPRLTKYLIIWAKIFGITVIEKYINILDKANKVKACREVYASVHKMSPDDPDLHQFFKLKGWL